jgi:uncharacterized protein (TIGR02594 family)
MYLTRSRALLAMCSIASIALASPALAKPSRHASVHRAQHTQHVRGIDRHPVRHVRHQRYRGRVAPTVFASAPAAPALHVDDRIAPVAVTPQVRSTRAPRVARRRAVYASTQPAPRQPINTFASSDVVSEARRWIGSNPTNRRSLWCGAFMNFVLERTGHHGSGSNLARSFAAYGYRLSGPQVGAIAVMARRGGGHVGVVSGIDSTGNPIIVSGNHGRRVAESVYPRGRVYAYVMPR